MTQVIFKFDKNKDLENTWETANKECKFGFDFRKQLNLKLLKVCQNKSFRKCREELKQLVKPLHDSKLLSFTADMVQKAWNNIESEYFNRLEKITGKSLGIPKITAYLTTVQRCPYSVENNWYMFNAFGNIFSNLLVSGHELMHFHFHKYYYKNVQKKIGKDKTEELKEALSVMLNLEFRDLWVIPDTGYPNHKELRTFIEPQWTKNKDFDKLVNSCVDYLSNK